MAIYHGDFRDVLPRIDIGGAAIVTDPPWPGSNSRQPMPGQGQEIELFGAMVGLTAPLVRRYVIHLGCDTDPRFLEAIPAEFPFIRVCVLDYAKPHYKASILYSFDVAYVFGDIPDLRPGRHVLPGKVLHRDDTEHLADHPCPRRITHVEWLVRWFTAPAELVLDPFVGSATTLVACYRVGRRGVGIEISEEYCAVAVERLEQEMTQKRLIEPDEVPKPEQLVMGE